MPGRPDDWITQVNPAESAALSGDQSAVIVVVSALRSYRAEVQTLLGQRYRDGACDGASITEFVERVGDIEDNLWTFEE